MGEWASSDSEFLQRLAKNSMQSTSENEIENQVKWRSAANAGDKLDKFQWVHSTKYDPNDDKVASNSYQYEDTKENAPNADGPPVFG